MALPLRSAAACLVVLALVSVAPPPAAARAPGAQDATVILLSWDGVRHDYLERGPLPALERLMREGARAARLLPVFPSITFPTHVSLATGAPADRHGIVANRFWDRERGEFDYSNDASWLDAEPLWVAAERQGVRAAVYFWVGSETDWRGQRATHRMAPFDSKVSERAKVEKILAWLDLPGGERPRLVMAWWHGADGAGHRHGTDAPEVDEALRAQDRALGELLAGLDARDAWTHTTLLIVSDHGMVSAGDRLDARSLLREHGVRARVVHSSALAHVHLEDPTERDRAIEILDAATGVRAFDSRSLPRELRYAHPRRVGHVVALAEPPRVFGRGGSRGVADRIAHALGWKTGAHGYDVASVPEMAGILLAMGRGVAHGARLPEARALDVAATVAELLGIDAPLQSEGAPIPLDSDTRRGEPTPPEAEPVQSGPDLRHSSPRSNR